MSDELLLDKLRIFALQTADSLTKIGETLTEVEKVLKEQDERIKNLEQKYIAMGSAIKRWDKRYLLM